MTDIKEAQGLEVVGYLLAKGRTLSIWSANKDTDEPLCRLSDATAVIDQLKAENEVLTLRVMAGERQELAALKSAPVVMPERKNRKPSTHGALSRQEGWNACLDEVARLNRR